MGYRENRFSTRTDPPPTGPARTIRARCWCSGGSVVNAGTGVTRRLGSDGRKPRPGSRALVLRLRIRRRLGRSQVFLIPPCMAQQEGGGDLPRDLPPPLTEVRPNLRTDNEANKEIRGRTDHSLPGRRWPSNRPRGVSWPSTRQGCAPPTCAASTGSALRRSTSLDGSPYASVSRLSPIMAGADICPASPVDVGAPKWVIREAWPSTHGRPLGPSWKPGSPCAGSVRSVHFRSRRHLRPSRVSGRGGRPRFLANSAQMMRTFVLATATMARLVPRRSRNSFTHRLSRSVLPTAGRTMARAPWTKGVRRCWSPRLPIRIRIVRSALDCWRETGQAAMWRPLSKSRPSPTAAMTAVAVFGPTPRIRPTRWQASLARKTRSMRRSNAFTRVWN